MHNESQPDRPKTATSGPETPGFEQADADTPAPASPCIRNCCLNDGDVCLGCARTLQEILDWHRLTPLQKQQVLNDLARRKQAFKSQHTRTR